MKFYESISDAARETLFAEMRRLHDRADRHAERYKALAPRNGAIAAGGAHFDEFLKGEAINDFLRGLNRGKHPEEAADYAKAEARQAIAKWNARREALVHRWDGAADATIESCLRQITVALTTVAEASTVAA